MDTNNGIGNDTGTTDTGTNPSPIPPSRIAPRRLQNIEDTLSFLRDQYHAHMNAVEASRQCSASTMEIVLGAMIGEEVPSELTDAYIRYMIVEKDARTIERESMAEHCRQQIDQVIAFREEQRRQALGIGVNNTNSGLIVTPQIVARKRS